MKKEKLLDANVDLAAEVNQSAVDKLLNSVKYPFPVFTVHNNPPTVALGAATTNDYAVDLTDAQVTTLLAAVTGNIKPRDTGAPANDQQVYSEILSNLAVTIESAKNCLNAREQAEAQGKPFTGPDPAFLNGILTDGVAHINKIAGIKFQAICSDLAVIADNKPTLTLGGPQIGIGNTKITVKATGQLWWYHPTLHCSHLCFNWSVTWGWSLLASVSVSVDIALDAVINLAVNGKVLDATLHFNKLRLDYPILRDIPLEGLANRVLGSKQIQVFDAGSFVASVPVINSKFTIDTISIPVTTGSIGINVAIKQI